MALLYAALAYIFRELRWPPAGGDWPACLPAARLALAAAALAAAFGAAAGCVAKTQAAPANALAARSGVRAAKPGGKTKPDCGAGTLPAGGRAALWRPPPLLLPDSSSLAYYNLPAAQTFDRSAAQVTVTGIVDSYPLLVKGRQDFLMAATTIEQAATPGGTAPVVRAGACPRHNRQ